MKQNTNVILIGFMGSGKTSVGEQLASQLLFTFQDTDQLIEEQVGDTIKHVFETKGEGYFRDLETDLLKRLLHEGKKKVLSAGGGVPVREENRKLLRELGIVIYLRASKETLLKRLKGDQTRPLLQGDSLEAKINQLLKEREIIYQETSHIQIDTDHKSKKEIVSEICRSLEVLNEDTSN